MGLRFEHECPQCGAPVQLAETDRLLECPFCHVSMYLYAPNYYRFVLPDKAPDADVFYAPYLRFRGNVFVCGNQGIRHRVVDLTQLATPLAGVPASLGLRPQAMTMRFAQPRPGRSFLRFDLDVAKLMDKVTRLPGRRMGGDVWHRAFIGETLSIIYLPLFEREGLLHDAVLDRVLEHPMGPGRRTAAAARQDPEWGLTFLPTLCPHCGWNLEGAKDSSVLVCRNCSRMWEPANGRFGPVPFGLVPAVDAECAYLPFWRIVARFDALGMRTYGDFLRVTAQPHVPRGGDDDRSMAFWIPGFKIRPRLLLNLARQLSVVQPEDGLPGELKQHRLWPVTLPLGEARQMLKLTLAAASMTREKLFPALPHLRPEVESSSLIFLPFADNGREFVQPRLAAVIDKRALEFGRAI